MTLGSGKPWLNVKTLLVYCNSSTVIPKAFRESASQIRLRDVQALESTMCRTVIYLLYRSIKLGRCVRRGHRTAHTEPSVSGDEKIQLHLEAARMT